MGSNRPLMDQLFESDILLTSRQMKAIVLAEAEKKSARRRRVKRKVITGGVYRWPAAPIPYSFREPEKKWRVLIQEGLKLWKERLVCVFERTDQAKIGSNSSKAGCYSSVGRTGGNQKISIGLGCEDKGIVSHEVGHSLGFWHEQSRPDRDKYIHLDDQYIAGGTEGNFAKRSDLEIDGMGLPYDLGSVMHYGPNAFTTDWDHITIEVPTYDWPENWSSFIDVKQINRLYCHQTCAGTPVKCENGGYANPNDCMQCNYLYYQPHFLFRQMSTWSRSPSCNLVQPSETICGGDLQASGVWQHLTHKGKRKCIWRIKADSRARIRFILDSVNYKCDSTCKSFVEIKHNSDFQQIGFRACCEEKNLEVLSEQDEIIVIASTDAEHTTDGAFTLRYIKDSGTSLPRPPLPAWIPGRENRAFRGVQGSGGVIEKFILNAIPRVRDPDKPVESVFSILTDYFASSILGTQRDH
uniref:Zinc metalloproteinase n=1 Tax=Ditylenchus dipsaci TaxID=166011 RepID=A0A915E7K6_9BILA